MTQKSTTLQFSEEQFKEMEMYVKQGYYSSKAELVREAVRDKLRLLEKDELYKQVLELRKKSKKMGAKITSPFISEKDSDALMQRLAKKKGLKL